jgi:hypothetical protein
VSLNHAARRLPTQNSPNHRNCPQNHTDSTITRFGHAFPQLTFLRAHETTAVSCPVSSDQYTDADFSEYRQAVPCINMASGMLREVTEQCPTTAISRCWLRPSLPLWFVRSPLKPTHGKTSRSVVAEGEWGTLWFSGIAKTSVARFVPGRSLYEPRCISPHVVQASYSTLRKR